MSELNLRETLATQNFSIQKVVACLYHEHNKSVEQLCAMFGTGRATVINNVNSWNGLNEKQQAKAREGALVAMGFVFGYDDSDKYSDMN